MSEFAEQYGPWALVAGASDGVGSAMAAELARRGLNVALLARRQVVLDDVAAGIRESAGVQTRTLAIDLAAPHAAREVIEATGIWTSASWSTAPARIPGSRRS